MNKKILKAFYLSPILTLPVLAIVSCSNTNQDQANQAQSDQNKAFANTRVLYDNFKNVFQGWLPSEVKLAGFSGKGINLPKLDARQNFGFVTTLKEVANGNDDVAGTKEFKVVLTRGQENYEQTIKLSGFLKTVDQTNEKEDNLNPEKKLNGFSRNRKPIVRVELENNDKNSISTFLSKQTSDLVNTYKNKILKSQSSTLNQAQAGSPEIELSNLRQAKQNGIEVEYVDADVKLVSGTGDSKKASGTYTVRFYGFDPKTNNLRTAEMLEKNIQEFATFNTPMKGLAKGDYSDKKASDITSKELLNAEFDPDLLKQNVQATLQEFKNPNDKEGSIEATFNFSFPDLNGENDPKIVKTIKLYGFKV